MSVFADRRWAVLAHPEGQPVTLVGPMSEEIGRRYAESFGDEGTLVRWESADSNDLHTFITDKSKVAQACVAAGQIPRMFEVEQVIHALLTAWEEDRPMVAGLAAQVDDDTLQVPRSAVERLLSDLVDLQAARCSYRTREGDGVMAWVPRKAVERLHPRGTISVPVFDEFDSPTQDGCTTCRQSWPCATLRLVDGIR